jgi:transcriptional regulator with XRE-family HTH domain
MTPWTKLLALGDLIKQRREAAGLSRRQLADQALVAIEWLHDLESGAHMGRLLRLLAHPAMAGVLAAWRRILTSGRDSGGNNGHHGS